MTEQWLQRFRRDEFKGTHNNASFKGIPFIIVSADSDFGRRTVEHEFPGQDVPYVEDLGKKGGVFSVEGQLLGGDYLEQRDQLKAACEEAGPGELIHPYYGTLNVTCKSITIRDSRRSTRHADFQIVFVETGELIVPYESVDTTAAVRTNSDLALANLEAPFVDNYAAPTLQNVFNAGKAKMLGGVLDSLGDIKTTTDITSSYVRDLAEAKESVDALILEPDELYNTLLNLITDGLYEEVLENAREIYDGLRTLFDFTLDVRESSDDSDSIKTLTQTMAVVSAGYILSRIEYESQTEADELQKEVFDKINSLIETGDLDDEVVQNLKDLRGSIVADIESRSGTLARLVDYTPKITLPALVLSYQLYGTIDEEQDIIDRNKVEHPGFVPGGEPAEVLLNA